MNSERLVLVRHGETIGDSVIRYYGQTDIELSELGRAQMRAAQKLIKECLAPRGFNQVFASHLQRATEGAHIIAGPDVKIIEIEEFAEVDFGDFEGLTSEEIRERLPAEYVRWNRDRLAPDFTYPHGENRAAFVARVERGLDRMLALLGTSASPRRSHSKHTEGISNPSHSERSEESRIVLDSRTEHAPNIVNTEKWAALLVAHRGLFA